MGCGEGFSIIMAMIDVAYKMKYAKGDYAVGVFLDIKKPLTQSTMKLDAYGFRGHSLHFMRS